MDNERAILELLRQRNKREVAACSVTRSYERLLQHCALLQEQCTRQKQRADLVEKEKHEIAADLQLLQQNEANAGVSREHIEVLQQQLERAKTEAAESVHELRQQLEQATKSEERLRTENERLLQRLMDQLQQQAAAMDLEVEAHEKSLRAEKAAAAAAKLKLELGGDVPLGAAGATSDQPAGP